MAADGQDYPAMLGRIQPPIAVNILNDRVQQIPKLNAAIADWLQDRRRLEEQYARGLRALAKVNLDGADLGIFSVPWTTLTGSLDTIADSHATLATKLEVDVERPLREFANSNREMEAMGNAQGNLRELAKDVEKAQQKADKVRSKAESRDGNRRANATLELDTAQASWDSLAPSVFSSLQSLDETRLNHLRDALTQYQTHELDQVERNRVSGEQCLNVLLNIETADEIKTFPLRAVQARPALGRTQRSSFSQGTPSRGNASAVPAAVAPALATTQSRSEEDLTREPTGGTEEKSKSRVKGLRRLGTVLGRKRDSKLPAGASSVADSPSGRSRPSPLGGSRSGRSREDTPTLATLDETSPQQRPGMAPQLGSEIFDAPSEVRADPSTPPPTTRNFAALPQINGTPFSVPPPGASSSAFANGSSHQNDLAGLDPPQAAFAERKESLRALEGQQDPDGFSVPPPSADPISLAQQEAALSDETASPALNVNIRDAPIQEDSAAGADLVSMARLQAPPLSTKRTSTIRGRRTDRNSTLGSAFISAESSAPTSEPISETTPKPVTRDVPASALPSGINTDVPTAAVSDAGMTMSPASTFGAAAAQLAASTFSPFSPVGQQSPPRFDSRAGGSMDQLKADTQSIRSATTAGGSAAFKHPDFTEPGLSSSIVETVSARFEKGGVVSSSLIGEVALAYNLTDSATPATTETIRLENFGSLEKVAPNPAFVEQTPERSGEYTVNLSRLARTQVAFKYQVRVDDAGAHAPLLITPALKIEPAQCSIIVSYSLNPAFALHGRTEIVLTNAMLALTIEGTKATGCQSRPVGTFAREKGLIYWQLDAVTLTPGAPPTKLLARFATESEATGAGVEAKWEIISSGAGTGDLGSALSVSMQGAAGEGSDPFADESAQAGAAAAWKPVQGVRKLASGSYVAK